MYLPSIVIVGYYFDKKRALATGIAVCGSGIGTFIFGPFTRILLDNYGWKGTNWIIAGIILNGVAMGALFRPLEQNKPIKKKEDVEEIKRGIIIEKIIAEKKRQRTISTGSMDGSLITKDNKFIKDPDEVKKILEKYNTEWQAKEKALERVPSTGSSTGMQRVPSFNSNTGSDVPNGKSEKEASNDQHLKSNALKPPRVRHTGGFGSTSSLRKRTLSGMGEDEQMLTASQQSLRARAAFKPMYRQDIFYSGSVTSLAEYKSTQDMESYVKSITSLPDIPDDPDSCAAKCLPLVHVLKEMLDFSLMRSVTFVILCTASVLAMTGNLYFIILLFAFA